VAVVSLPDFDPNNPREAKDPDRINRLTTNVYEMGSTFKAFTLAILASDREHATRSKLSTTTACRLDLRMHDQCANSQFALKRS